MVQTFRNIEIYYDENLNSDIVEKLIDGIKSKYNDIVNFFEFECDKLSLNIFTKEDFNAYVASKTCQFGGKDNIPNWLTRFFYFR